MGGEQSQVHGYGSAWEDAGMWGVDRPQDRAGRARRCAALALPLLPPPLKHALLLVRAGKQNLGTKPNRKLTRAVLLKPGISASSSSSSARRAQQGTAGHSRLSRHRRVGQADTPLRAGPDACTARRCRAVLPQSTHAGHPHARPCPAQTDPKTAKGRIVHGQPTPHTCIHAQHAGLSGKGEHQVCVVRVHESPAAGQATREERGTGPGQASR